MKKTLKWIGIATLSSVAFILIVAIYNTLTFRAEQSATGTAPVYQEYPLMAERLSEAISLETISIDYPGVIDTTGFQKFGKFLGQQYPLVHDNLELTLINDLSLLFKWSSPSGTRKAPILLAAHYDVVPAENETQNQWSYPPFSGTISENYLYGRGALDNKQSVIGIMEAAEALLQEGYEPDRNIYIALGHDEEIGGYNGARAIASHLEDSGVQLAFTLDEGLVVTRGIVPGVERDVALIGLSEKGFVSIKIRVQAEGGHSAMPRKESAVSLLSAALIKLEENQMRPRLTPPVRKFFNTVGPEMEFPARAVIANLWLLEGLFLRGLLADPATASLVRTTTAPTILRAGDKENVIPGHAEATVNFRIIPGETIEDVIQHVKETIDDPRFSIRKTGLKSEPSPLSSSESEGYNRIKTAVQRVFPDALIAPSLMNAVADARHYSRISEDVYRFAPIVLESEDLKSIHGVNERISIDDLNKIPSFYREIITGGE